MPKKSLRREKITTFLLIALLAISFFALFLPQAAATDTAITSISPEKGPVGTETRVNGTIETTNGTYRILFDGEEVKNGTIIGNNVSDTFIIPHRPAGGYNITLQDINATSGEVLSGNVFPTPFTVKTSFYIEAIVPPTPQQLQEGDLVPIHVNVTGGEANTIYHAEVTVTDPGGATYWTLVDLTNTTRTGSGYNETIFPAAYIHMVDVKNESLGIIGPTVESYYLFDFTWKPAKNGSKTIYWYNRTAGTNGVVLSADYDCRYESSDLVGIKLTNPAPYNNTEITADYTYLNFSATAHTNITGWYDVCFVNRTDGGVINQTRFFIGLTNATEYHRFQMVNIRAANYTQPNEFAWINITCKGETVFYENVNASTYGGTVEANWAIPANATYGNYTTTVSSSTTPGTVKPILDIQNFTIAEKLVSCRILTVNLDSEPVEGVEVKSYNGYNETQQIGSPRKTDKKGSANFQLDAGKYVFKAFWKDLQVNQTVFDVAKDMNQTIVCQLAGIKVKVTEELTAEPLPFINVNLTYSYAKDNSTLTETNPFETNSTGRLVFRNLFTNLVTNVNYTIEARRYGNLFYTKVIENLTSTRWVNITCPTYTLTIEVFDSNELPFRNATLAVYEWSSGLTSDNRSYPFCIWISTNGSGSTDINCTFGRYKVKVYVSEVVVNKTTVDLINETQKLQIYCRIFNLTVPVKVVDYFGRAIPNIKVEVKREGTEPLEFTTVADGTASLHIKIGGNCSILLYLPSSSEPCETQLMYLDQAKTAGEITFKLSGYVMIGGYLLETSELTTIIILIVIAVVFAAALTYRRLSQRKMSKK